MTIQSGSPASTDVQETSRTIDTSEFLTRIAEKLRTKSGSDLPLSCFIEQVKLQLAGGKSPETAAERSSGRQQQHARPPFGYLQSLGDARLTRPLLAGMSMPAGTFPPPAHS